MVIRGSAEGTSKIIKLAHVQRVSTMQLLRHVRIVSAAEPHMYRAPQANFQQTCHMQGFPEVGLYSQALYAWPVKDSASSVR